MTIETVGTECFAEFDALFRVCFDTPADLAVHRWKYERPGALRFALRDEQGCAAFYGIMPREVLYHGTPLVAAQGCDVMVHPRARSLRRDGAYATIARAAFTAAFAADPRVRLSYGFPNDRTLRAAARLGMYDVLGEVVECRWSPLPGALPRPLADHELERFVDPAWEAMRREMAERVLGVRTASWARDRFFAHPAASDYGLYAVTDGDAAVLAVRRHADRLEVMDVIGPRHLWPACLTTARALAAQASLASVFGWFVDWAAPLLGPDAAIHSIGVRIPNQILAPGGVKIGPDDWWLSAADSDFR